MTSTIKLTIQKKDSHPAGPYHWKHLVEWHEFGLMDDFYWTNLDGELQSVSDLVDQIGVPPTICTNAILQFPTNNKKNPHSEIIRKLKVIGFPKDIQSVTDDLGKHLLHRLLMSDEALNAEDPGFQVKDPKSYPSEAAQTLSVSTSGKDSVNPSPQTMTDNIEKANDDAPQEETPVDISNHAVDPKLNPFIEGDEVDDNQADDHNFSPIKKGGFKSLIFLPLILALAIGAGVYVFWQQQQEEAKTPETSGEDVLPVAAEETPLSEPTEAVEEVLNDVTTAAEEVVTKAVETAEAITSDIQETTEEAVEDVMNAAEDAQSSTEELVSEVVSDAENSTVSSAITSLSDQVNAATTESLDSETDSGEEIETTEDESTAETETTEGDQDLEDNAPSSDEANSEETAPNAISDLETSEAKTTDASEVINAADTNESTDEAELNESEPDETSIKLDESPEAAETSEDEAETSEALETQATPTTVDDRSTSQSTSTIVIDSTGTSIEVVDERNSSTRETTNSTNTVEEFPDYVPTY